MVLKNLLNSSSVNFWFVDVSYCYFCVLIWVLVLSEISVRIDF